MPLRGLEQQQEQSPQALLRDTRTIGQRVSDFFKNATNSVIVIMMLAVGGVVSPALSDVALLIGLGIFFFCINAKTALPFRLPLRSKADDYNDPQAGTGKPQKGRGIYFLGNEIKSNNELWFSNEDMRTHLLIFGSTGSGKTEALVSIAYNALVQGSGFIYVDGKGDNSLFAKVFSMVRAMGRDDDILLINFMTGARDIIGPQERRLSNTLNPFSMGSSSMLSQLVVSLMPSSGDSSDGDMWKGRAITFVEALMKVLVYMRDQGHLLLDANTIRNYFALDKIEPMYTDRILVREGREPINLATMPPIILEPIDNYLINLPGYNRANKGKQVSQVLEQHGFITMQLTRVFSSLADTYGHIMRTNLAEVDFKDVVLNRRILVVLLPALEKAPDELAALGKVIIAALKAMMAAGLGDQVEGTYQDVIKRKPTTAPTPFLCVLDEYGYYAVKGFAVVPAQARSLGFSAIFAGQDLPAFQKASKEEAMSIGANTNIKIARKLEDPLETWDFFAKTAGEAYVTKVDSFQTDSKSMTNSYMDTRSSSAEKRARIDLLDLKDQREGEAHIFFKSRIVRARMFYANPEPAKNMRLNHFLKVEVTPRRKLINFERNYHKFSQLVSSGNFQAPPIPLNEEIAAISDSLRQNELLNPIERGVNALLAYHNLVHKEAEQHDAELMVEEEIIGKINLFAKAVLPDDLRSIVLTENLEAFVEPLLSKRFVHEKIELMQRLDGKSTQEAGTIAAELIRDMDTATQYPPEILAQPTPESLARTTMSIAEKIKQLVSGETGGEGGEGEAAPDQPY
jgi:intracellular multiplication protein IcmO